MPAAVTAYCLSARASQYRWDKDLPQDFNYRNPPNHAGGSTWSKIRDRDDWRGRDWAGAKGRPDDNLRSGVLNSHCYGTHKRAGSQLDATDGIAAVVDGTTGGDCAEADHSCPRAGCFNCPAYFYALSSHEIEKSGDELSVDGRGQNPVYQARAVEQAAIRAVWRGKLECQIEHASADATSVDL